MISHNTRHLHHMICEGMIDDGLRCVGWCLMSALTQLVRVVSQAVHKDEVAHNENR